MFLLRHTVPIQRLHTRISHVLMYRALRTLSQLIFSHHMQSLLYRSGIMTSAKRPVAFFVSPEHPIFSVTRQHPGGPRKSKRVSWHLIGSCGELWKLTHGRIALQQCSFLLTEKSEQKYGRIGNDIEPLFTDMMCLAFWIWKLIAYGRKIGS